MKTCVSYSHRFECQNDDRLLVLRLNKLERSNETPIHQFVCKLERSNRTPNHRFICKFDRENETKGKFPKSRLV